MRDTVLITYYYNYYYYYYYYYYHYYYYCCYYYYLLLPLLPIQVLCGASLLTSACKAGAEPRDFPLPRSALLASPANLSEAIPRALRQHGSVEQRRGYEPLVRLYAGRDSTLKVPPWQRPSSAPAPPQGAPGGSGQPTSPRVRGAGPLGAQPLSRAVEPAASKAAGFTACASGPCRLDAASMRAETVRFLGATGLTCGR